MPIQFYADHKSRCNPQSTTTSCLTVEKCMGIQNGKYNLCFDCTLTICVMWCKFPEALTTREPIFQVGLIRLTQASNSPASASTCMIIRFSEAVLYAYLC